MKLIRRPSHPLLIAVFVALMLSSVFVIGTSTSQVKDLDGVSESTDALDIYYIIMDEYSRNDVLLDMYGFDNSEFTAYLKDKGFYVAEDSYANYPSTFLSLPSSLDMDYLPKEYSPYTIDKMIRTIRTAEVLVPLKQRGYTLINISTFFRDTDVDINYNYDTHSEFTSLFHEMSVLYVEDTKEKHCYNRTLYRFDKLKKVPLMPGPTFTFVHIMATHTPYVFNADGSYRRHNTPAEGPFEAYIHQIEAVNRMLQDTIDTILAEGDAVIILQSDTSPFTSNYHTYLAAHGGTTNNAMQEEPSIVWARLAILTVVYPDIGYRFTSPVNTFRAVFNHCFDTDYDILPDRYFWARENGPPFEVFEVTNELQEYINTR